MKELDYADFFFTPINILSTLVFLSGIIIWTHFKSNSLEGTGEARIYRWNVFHKLFFSFVFAVYYIAVFKGGDTYSYWESMGALKKLMFYNFRDFWEVVTNEPTMERLHGFFNYQTGYPPRFIYMEEESFFVAKVILILRLITFDSYLATTFLLAFLMGNASWKVYTLARDVGIFNRWLLMIFTLFLPSVAFWASGISKDTIIYISIANMIYYLNRSLRSAFNIKSWLLLLFYTFLIYNIRPFILYAMLVPLTLMYLVGLVNKIKDFVLLRVAIKGVAVVCATGVVAYVLNSSIGEMLIANQSLEEAIVVQQDFQNNTQIYGGDDGKRYSLGEVDYTSLTGLMKAVPASIIAGLYRPFLWEAFSPSLIFNGFESMFFIFMTVWFFVSKPFLRMEAISKHELLVFSLGFILIIAFMAGFTSILFGVLVRIRAPLLPFFGLLLSIDWKLYLQKRQAVGTT